MIGSLLGPYEITAKLGEGGMGEVYRARDARLDRDVALKVLPEEMASDPERLERFQREAKALAAIDHPGIVTVYSVEEADGVYFLTMQLVEGQPLNRLIPEGGMPVERTLTIAAALAEALAAAHAKGIVHRDLKPGNIMLTSDGRVKVLDFGLAKMSVGAGSGGSEDEALTMSGHLLTRAGTTLGTVAYMSPEQARGGAIDARSDLFSLGVVLYEMATGRLPFEGESSADFFAAILTKQPAPPRDLNPDVPGRLEEVILKALDKDPALRYQTAAGLRSDLLLVKREVSGPPAAGAPVPAEGRRERSEQARTSAGSRRGVWIGFAVAVALAIAVVGFLASRGGRAPEGAPAAAGVSEKSIAVLPFTNLSSDKEQEYFSDGISEDLLNLLTKIPELQVTARTSSFAFKGKDLGVPEIARRLHVAHVLEGSVQKAGDEVRITAQLVDAATDTQLWSQSWDRKLQDVFKIQDEIAGEVVRELKVKLLGAAPKARTTDPRAYALYLQAIQLGRQDTAEAFAKSDALYRRVLAIDPRYAPAWNGLASNFLNEANIGVLSNAGGSARAREAAEKALAIDPDYAPAHASLGWIAMADDDLAGAAQHYEHALTLDPGGLGVFRSVGLFLASLGRLDEALALQEAVVRRDPVNVKSLASLGCTERYTDHYDAAIARFRTVLSLSPGFGKAHFWLGVTLLLEGHARAALAEIEQETSEEARMIGLPMVYSALGRRADSDKALAALIGKYEKDAAFDVAYVYAFRGQPDEAFAWLDKAIGYNDPGLSFIVAENLFDNIHSDPRWLPFLRKLGKAPDQLAKIEFHVTLPEEGASSS